MSTRHLYPALLITLAFVAPALSGCAPRAVREADRKPTTEILVAAASDLTLAMPELQRTIADKTDIKVVVSLGSSGLLARQIENGAPMDVYLSANKTYVDQLTADELVAEAKPYAQGFLALIGKAKSLDNLSRPDVKRIAIANPDHAPYGQAAKEALRAGGLWTATRNKLVYGENVAQAFDLVNTGNADAGFVSLSLVKRSKTAYVLVDQRLYPPIKQWAGIIKSSKKSDAAKTFVDFLTSEDARKILIKYGFQPVEEEAAR